MKEAYARKNYRPPFIATDLLMEYGQNGDMGLIIIERKNFPYGLAVPGGFVEYGLTLEENAVKEGIEETGLEAEVLNPEHPMWVISGPDRDPRAHIITTVYVGRVLHPEKDPVAGDDAKAAYKISYERLKSMLGKNLFAFPDHEEMIRERMRQLGK